MNLKRILVTTDFSSRSERALRRGGQLRRQLSAGLRLLHVVDGDQPAAVVEQACRQAEALLRDQAQALAAEAAIDTVVKVGDPFDEIVQVAVAGGDDLIVMGAHRKSLLRDIFVGTTIERVVRTGRHPVLMVNREPKGPYRSVMVATDLSEASANALQAAKDLGLLEGPRISLLHVHEPLAKAMMIYANVERERIEEHIAREAWEARRQLERFVAELGLSELAYDARIEEGPTYGSIRQAIERDDPDLLVIGTRGLTGARRLLLGSVADAVLRGVACDVLAVPPPNA